MHGITTLGFRGEALAATAAVSRLTLASSHDDSGVGRQLQVAGVLDDEPKLLPVVHSRGTTITVKDLYFNVPARRGNLKSIATEFGHIETIVREVALARADVALTLFHDNKKRLSLSSRAMSSSASSSRVMSANDNSNNNANRLPLSRLEQATGLPLTDNALEISIDLTSLMQSPKAYIDNNFGSQAIINGWLWPITDSQDALPKLIYVNGRLVKEALISNQLRQLAQSAKLAGIGYALYFDLPTEWLNINVHPSKQRIKISPLNNIMAHLSHAIRTKLKNAISKKTINFVNDDSQVLNNSLSINNTFAAQMEQTSSTTHSTKSQQVQAPKQPYQLSENMPTSQTVNTSVISENINQNTSDISNDVAINSTSLPYCLDVIDDLNKVLTEFASTTYIEDKALPLLLFYYQSQHLLISAADWQAKLSSLFESRVFRDTVLKNEKMLNSAAAINQQLATVSMQMSPQDLMIFIADMESVLVKHAIKSIDSHRLVALMLSSAPE